MPQPRDNVLVNGHALIDEPVEGEALEAHVAHELLKPEPGIEEPLPRHAGDDEGHGVGEEEDRSKHALAEHALVDEHGEKEAENEAAGDEQRDDDEDVL